MSDSPDNTEPASADRQALNVLETRLLPLVQRVSGIARSSSGLVRTLFIVAGVSAVWLMLYLQEVFNFSLGIGIVVLLLLLVPAVILGLFYLALLDAMGLVDEVNELIAALRDKVGDWHGQATTALQSGVRQTFKVGSLFSVGMALRELWSFSDEVGGLALKLKSLAITFNPFVLVVLVIAMVVTFPLALAAMITAILLLLSR